MAVHPRIRGADGIGADRKIVLYGSPPHTRGRLMYPTITAILTTVHPRIRGADVDTQLTVHLVDRFTPAYAGQMISEQQHCIELDGSPPHTRDR